jgi:two-component system, cell cycle sensor histidine kinase and response regulator CckA
MKVNRILIADDKEENIYFLRTLLEGNGYEAIIAGNGAEALDLARRNPPDLIISDLLMPVMDGYMLLRHWKADESLRTIPFVVYTATYTDEKDEHLARDLGADDFILKPTEPEPFMARIQEVLARAKQGELSPGHAPQGEISALTKAYNETLIRKLEAKAIQLEETNRRLQQYIEERKQVEMALRESESRFRSLIVAAPEGIFVQSESRFVYLNPAMIRLLGASTMEELLGKNFLELIAPEYQDAVRSRIQFQMETGNPALSMDQEYLRLDGARVPVETTAIAVTYQDRPVHLVFVRDITERKQMEAKQAEQLKELQRWHGATLGREERVLKLKREVNDLLAELGKSPRYQNAPSNSVAEAPDE